MLGSRPLKFIGFRLILLLCQFKGLIMDQCTHCTVKGDIKTCMKTTCSQHESWMVGELIKALAKTGCHDIFCDKSNRVCRDCLCYYPNRKA